MKTKKINIVIITAIILCVLCSIGLTVAKYLTSNTKNDSANVAKFGVTVSVDASGVFSKEYKNGDKTIVVSSNKVVAPGTSGALAKIEVSGTPEVNVEVAYKVNVDFGENWKDSEGNVYMPLVITVGETEYKIDSTYATVEALETAIATEVKSQYAAGTSLSDITNVVSWTWAFESGNDVNDTYLANQTGDKAPSISVTIEASVTQINTGIA